MLVFNSSWPSYISSDKVCYLRKEQPIILRKCNLLIIDKFSDTSVVFAPVSLLEGLNEITRSLNLCISAVTVEMEYKGIFLQTVYPRFS